MSRRQGDVSRRRRTADPIRWAYYAAHRSRRWAKRFFGEVPAAPAERGKRDKESS